MDICQYAVRRQERAFLMEHDVNNFNENSVFKRYCPMYNKSDERR